MMTTGMRGTRAEELAAKYLTSAGLKLVARNYRSRFGEIDLIMLDGETLVFIEVRYRASNKYGGALASVDAKKQAKLSKTATTYLLKHHALNQPARFDVLCMSGELSSPIYDWISNAF